MKILICDDDELILNDLKQTLLELFPETEDIVCFNSAQKIQAFSSTADLFEFDVLIMDIALNDKQNGLEIASYISKINPKIKVVFLTGFADLYQQKIFLNNTPSGFITKPIQKNILHAVLFKIQNELTHQTLTIQSTFGTLTLDTKNIVFIESVKRVCKIHTKKEIIDTYIKLNHLEENLGQGFFRCHQSFLLNMDFVLSLEKNAFLLIDGLNIPISRKHLQSARNAYFMHKGAGL